MSENIVLKDLEGFKSREPFLRKIIKNYFPKNKDIRIVEIGCGHGAFQYFIQKFGYKNSIGVDGSQEQVNLSKKLNIDNIIHGDLVEYIKSLNDNSLDLLIALDVIEHFTKEELSNLVDDMYRVLKKGGLIITHQPNGESILCNSIRYGDFTHEIAFTRNSISQIFLSSGFSGVYSYEDKPIVHGLKSLIRFLLWNYLVRPIYKILIIIETGGVDKEIIMTQNFLTVVTK